MAARSLCAQVWMLHRSLRLPELSQSDTLRAKSEHVTAQSSFIGALRLATQRVEQYVGRFQQWVLPRSRLLLVALIGANLLVALSLTLLNSPLPEPEANAEYASLPQDQRSGSDAQASSELPTTNIDATTELQLADSREGRKSSTVVGSPEDSSTLDREIAEVANQLVDANDTTTSVNEAATAHDERVCRVWGPEQKESAFNSLAKQLDALGGFPEVRKRTVQSTPDFLVYIDDLGSRDNAKRVAAELASVKTDSYLIIAEDGRPILSVGVFSRRALADRQHNRMQKLGYKVGLQTVERTQVVFNLTAHVPLDSPEYESSTSSCVEIAQGS